MPSPKGCRSQIIELFDFAFDLLNREQKEALNRLMDFESEFPKYQYFAITLRYIAADFTSTEEMRVKRARKVLLDAIEQFCMEELKKK